VTPADTIREALYMGPVADDHPRRTLFDAALAALTELEAEVTRWQDGYDVAAMRANRAEAKVVEALRVTAAAAEVDTARAEAAEADRDRHIRLMEEMRSKPCYEAFEERDRLRIERDDYADTLRRLRQWDHLDGAGDGPYWKREIDAALDRHTNPTLNENDLRIEPWGHGTPDMSGVQKNPRGVRITHIPSGHVAEWDGEKSQLRNREIALGALRSMLALDRHTKEPDDPQIFGPPRSFPKATT
jgi:hypothetical protein